MATKRGRGRPPGFRMPEAHRHKIKVANILSVLQKHVEGKRDMSATQVTAGLGLLRKVLPDLQVVESTGELTIRKVKTSPMTPEEWRSKHAGSDD